MTIEKAHLATSVFGCLKGREKMPPWIFENLLHLYFIVVLLFVYFAGLGWRGVIFF